MNSTSELLPPSELRARWEEAAAAEPRSFPSEIARRLQVSEGELLASKIGHGYTRLRREWPEILQSLSGLGEVKAITRNEAAVLERNGRYPEFQHFGMHSMFVGEAIDLRITLHEWHFALAASNPVKNGRPESHSLQFFAKDGVAVHKLFLTPGSELAAFEQLVARFEAPDQSAGQSFSVNSQKGVQTGDPLDREAFLDAWSKLEDTHGFFGLLHGFKVSRPQAMRLAEGRFTRRVSNDSARTLLYQVAKDGVPLMVFIGNKGCLQIHKGVVKKVVPAHGWLNVLDPGAEVHLKEEHIVDSWVVEKPTSDGLIRSLELFDGEGQDILSLFGVRSEGKRQSLAWHASLEALK